MGYNNSLYTLYKEMVEGYKTNENGLFEHGARCLMDLSPANPFLENSDDAELFFQMQLSYIKWKNHGPDAKLNYRKMLEYARKMCEAHSENPYTFDKEEAKKDLEEQKMRELETIKKLEEKRKAEEIRQQQEELKKQQEEMKKELEEKEKQKREEKNNDSKYILLRMAESYNLGNNDDFKQCATHLMEITLENPFAEETPEFLKFEEMKESYLKHNMRRVHVLAKELCNIINYTEIEPEKINLEKSKKILGVPEEKKRSWFKFLHPWR